jgi:hypothetical protein
MLNIEEIVSSAEIVLAVLQVFNNLNSNDKSLYQCICH